jgi:hypothetical protein
LGQSLLLDQNAQFGLLATPIIVSRFESSVIPSIANGVQIFLAQGDTIGGHHGHLRANIL